MWFLVACQPADKPTEDTSGDPADLPPAVAELGTDQTRAFEVVADSSHGLLSPSGMAVDPTTGILWVVDYDGWGVLQVDGAEPADELLIDVYDEHFMHQPTGIAFGQGTTFATCHDSRNEFGVEGAGDFMGPTLWDTTNYALVNQNGRRLGSHIDMLHEAPHCMGIAWEAGNAYWVFEGLNGSLMYFDFQEDHGPGMDDHSDGIVRRFEDVVLSRVEGVPGHIVRVPDTGLLYVADTGTGRILAVDVTTAEEAHGIRQEMEPLAEYTAWTGATVTTFAEGLGMPSGLFLHEGRLFATDAESSEIVVWETGTGEELVRVQTDADRLAGLTLGADGAVWYLDQAGAELVRVAVE